MEINTQLSAQVQIKQIPCRRFPVVRTNIYIRNKKVGSIRGNRQLVLELPFDSVKIVAKHMGKEAILEKVLQPGRAYSMQLIHNESSWFKGFRYVCLITGTAILGWGLSQKNIEWDWVTLGFFCVIGFLDLNSDMTWSEADGETMSLN
jgi:hypothetical protein